jgi:hypothetical protein
MALTTFTSGQVLTAAQLNAVQANDYNQTVSTKTASYTLVAADKGTRVVMNVASANTVTVNTSLFSAGDTLVIQNIGAGVTTVTAGTATVSSAGPLAIPTNGSGTLYFSSAGVSIFYPSAGPAASSGLTLISATTIGSAVSSVTVTGAFSATYDTYKIVLVGGTGSVSDADINVTLGATATGYYLGQGGVTYAASATDRGTDNGSSWEGAGRVNTDGNNLNIDLNAPFLSKITFITGAVSNGSNARMFAGRLANTTSYTTFTITPSGSTITGGTLYVYGYANS